MPTPPESYRRLEPWLAAGAQPVADSYRWLVRQGFDAVVNLRAHEDATLEREAPELLGMRIAVKNHRPPGEEQVRKWLALCELCAREGRALYVHCHAGHGRTSTFCVVSRLAQGWDVERAIDEEQRYGFDPDEETSQAEFLRTKAPAIAAQIRLPTSSYSRTATGYTAGLRRPPAFTLRTPRM